MGLAQPAPKFDFDSYTAWEAEQPERHEWVDGEVFAMTGARDAHNRISLNIAAALKAALRGTPCRTFMSDMKLQAEEADASFYPDVMVTCDPRDLTDEADLAKRHAKLVVEVISDSTGAYDRGRKFEIYRSMPSVEEVMFVEQSRMQVDLFRRNAQGRWELYPSGAGEVVALSSLGLALSVVDVYEDVLTPGG
jgi:Uma2 family endonuclease